MKVTGGRPGKVCRRCTLRTVDNVRGNNVHREVREFEKTHVERGKRVAPVVVRVRGVPASDAGDEVPEGGAREGERRDQVVERERVKDDFLIV